MGLIEQCPERMKVEFCGEPTCHGYGTRAADYCNDESHVQTVVYVRADTHRGAVEALRAIAELHRVDGRHAPRIASEALTAMGVDPSTKP